MLMGLLIAFILVMFTASFMGAMIDAASFDGVTAMTGGAGVLAGNIILFLVVVLLVVIVKVMSDKSM